MFSSSGEMNLPNSPETESNPIVRKGGTSNKESNKNGEIACITFNCALNNIQKTSQHPDVCSKIMNDVPITMWQKRQVRIKSYVSNGVGLPRTQPTPRPSSSPFLLPSPCTCSYSATPSCPPSQTLLVKSLQKNSDAEK